MEFRLLIDYEHSRLRNTRQEHFNPAGAWGDDPALYGMAISTRESDQSVSLAELSAALKHLRWMPKGSITPYGTPMAYGCYLIEPDAKGSDLSLARTLAPCAIEPGLEIRSDGGSRWGETAESFRTDSPYLRSFFLRTLAGETPTHGWPSTAKYFYSSVMASAVTRIFIEDAVRPLRDEDWKATMDIINELGPKQDFIGRAALNHAKSESDALQQWASLRTKSTQCIDTIPSLAASRMALSGKLPPRNIPMPDPWADRHLKADQIRWLQSKQERVECFMEFLQELLEAAQTPDRFDWKATGRLFQLELILSISKYQALELTRTYSFMGRARNYSEEGIQQAAMTSAYFKTRDRHTRGIE